MESGNSPAEGKAHTASWENAQNICTETLECMGRPARSTQKPQRIETKALVGMLSSRRFVQFMKKVMLLLPLLHDEGRNVVRG